jgi:hypothetical protein
VDQVLIRVLTSHFLDATYLFNSNLNYLVFNENQAQGKIRIALHTNFDAASSDKVPAIIVKRMNAEATRVAMGDEGQGTDLATSVYQYVRRIRGQHQIVVLSSVDGEAEDLGMEVFDTLTTASPLLVSRYPFADFQVTGITELQIMSELGNRYGVVITTQYDYEYGWKITPGDDIAPLVTGFNVNTTFVAQ